MEKSTGIHQGAPARCGRWQVHPSTIACNAAISACEKSAQVLLGAAGNVARKRGETTKRTIENHPSPSSHFG